MDDILHWTAGYSIDTHQAGLKVPVYVHEHHGCSQFHRAVEIGLLFDYLKSFEWSLKQNRK